MKVGNGALLQPTAETSETFVRARNHLHADHLPDLGGGGSSGIGRGLDRGDVAPEKTGDVAAADLFPADQGDVGGFERGVSRFEEGAEAFCFDHSNGLLRHKKSAEFSMVSCLLAGSGAVAQKQFE